MDNSKNHTGSQIVSTLAHRTLDFEGQPVTAVMFRGRWCWRGAEVGAAIGYEEGRYLTEKIRGEWAEDFREGTDYEVLRGPSLKAFRELYGETPETSKFAGRLVVLYESGIDRALLLSRTEKGRRQERLVERITERAARDRQLSLRAVGSNTR